jgi:penicillin-binding protein-related factor A (putative recombinase)
MSNPSAQRVEAGRKANAAGAAFEEALEISHNIYSAHDTALIVRNGTRSRATKVDGGIVYVPDGRSMPDFFGCTTNPRRTLSFDAKSLGRGHRYGVSTKQHLQFLDLQDWQAFGAIAGYIVELRAYDPYRVYVVRIADLHHLAIDLADRPFVTWDARNGYDWLSLVELDTNG